VRGLPFRGVRDKSEVLPKHPIAKGPALSRSPWWLAALAATVVSAVATSAASADTYTVYSCKGPTGTPNGALGWAALPAPAGVGHVANGCPGAGPLSAWVDTDSAGTAKASWRFDAPADTRIVRFGAQRKTIGVGASAPLQTKDVSYVLETDTANLEVCDVSLLSSCSSDLSDPIDKQGLDAAFVRFSVLCTGLTCSRPLRADFDSTQVGLKDVLAPAVSAVKVLDSGDTTGVLTVGFSASDRGGGVYRAVVQVDGQPAIVQPLGDANCADANPADADPYQFLQPVPCPPAVNGAVVKVDYRKLAAGPHGVEIDVEDAAGNSTAVFGPIQFPRPNAENAPSTPASIKRLLNARLRMWFVKNRTKRFTSRYGQRVVTRGILRDRAGKAVRGARIDVYHRLRSGKRRLLKTGLKTRADGRVTLILPLNLDTRGIEYDYRALRPGKITSRQILRLTVMRHGRVFVRKLKSRT
jgi:hypothetical protein